MSQEGLVDILGVFPQIPTEFFANSGTAIPIANDLNLLGAVVAAGTNPFRSIGSGNTITYQVQIASAIAATDVTRIGISAFNSSDFSVDANGFVSLLGPAASSSFNVDASTPPGTDPVVPDGSGIVTITGGQVAAGTTANVIRTNSLSANTFTIEVQRSSAQAATTIGANGVSHFDNTDFTVDANGFVALSNDGPFVESVSGTADRITSTGGVNPVIDIAGTYVGQTSITTLGTITTGTWNGTAIEPTFGGTGQTTYATGDILYASAANTLSKLAATTNGFLLTLVAGIPAWVADSGAGIETINGDSGSVTGATVTLTGGTTGLTFGGASTTMTLSGNLIVANGGTGRTTLTDHGVLVGAGTTAITQLAVGATGTVLIGNTGADPSFSAAPSVTSITLSSGNALSTYIQGSFTPGVAFGGGTTGITYGSQVGQYTRIGNMVYFTFLVQMTSKGSSTGNVTLTGFPVAAAGNQCVMSAIKMTNFTINVGYTSVFTQTQNATSFEFFAHDPTLGDAAVTDVQFANNTDMRFEGFYFSS